MKWSNFLKPMLIFAVGLLLFLNLSLVTNIDTFAQKASIADLKILDIPCLIATGKGECTDDKALINVIIKFLVLLSFPLATLVIVWGGYQYFMGGIDGKSSGVKAIQGAVIGLLLVVAADFITKAVGQTFAGGVPNATPIAVLIGQIRTVLTGLATSVAVLVFVWGGYKYFFAGLDIEKEDGLKAVRNAAIGLFVIFLANTLVSILEEVATNLANNRTQNLADAVNKILQPIITDVTNLLFTLASLFAVLVIVWGGYKYFFSGLEIAKKDGLENIRKGVIGLVVIFLARPIVDLIRATIPENPTGTSPLNVQTNQIVDTFKFIIGNILIPISTVSAIFFMILGAYYWIGSNGDAKRAEKAQKAVQNSIIGLVIVLLSTTIVQLILFVFK